MKYKHTLLLLAIVLTSFCACKKTDKAQTMSIVGKWNLQNYEVKTYINGSLSSDKNYPVINNYLRLNSDNSGEILEDPAIEPTTGTITYIRSGSTLTITFDNVNFSINYVVNSLSSTALILQSITPVVNGTQSFVTYYYTK